MLQKSTLQGLTKLQKIIIGFLIILVVLILFNVGAHLYAGAGVKEVTREQAIVKVALVPVLSDTTTRDITLPGNIDAWHRATIYARTNGYMKRWLVDIGDPVKAGDLLAEIETPELDAQLRQAQADLEVAKVNEKIANITAERWKDLLPSEAVSKQETDQKISDALGAQALVIAATANRDHLKELVNFGKVIAPFDGIISKRTIDIGDLIEAGSDTKVALFEIVQSDQLRVYVRVPQNHTALISPDLHVKLQVPQYPERYFSATLLKNASAINGDSRTLLLEFVVENPNNELFAGSYATVSFSLPIPASVVRIPVNSLLFRANGLKVATVDAHHRVVLKSVVIGRDFGNYAEVVSGISAREHVIINPLDSLVSGQKVEVISTEDNKGQKET